MLFNNGKDSEAEKKKRKGLHYYITSTNAVTHTCTCVCMLCMCVYVYTGGKERWQLLPAFTTNYLLTTPSIHLLTTLLTTPSIHLLTTCSLLTAFTTMTTTLLTPFTIAPYSQHSQLLTVGSSEQLWMPWVVVSSCDGWCSVSFLQSLWKETYSCAKCIYWRRP